MVRLILEADVSGYVARVIAIKASTRKRIAISAALSAEGDAACRKTIGILDTSYDGLAARSAPFTVDAAYTR